MIQVIILFLLLSFSLVAEEIRTIRYLKPNGTFSEVSDLTIENGYIKRITESKLRDGVRYVLPSFCDANVTLGVNPAGGQQNLRGIELSLKSFLTHGFTHIQSIADGPWIRKIKTDIDTGKIVGPKITIAERPLLTKSNETKDLPSQLYFVADNKDLAQKEFLTQINAYNKSIHIFSRHNEDATFSFDSEFLLELRLASENKNKRITIHTFADRISILDALISGNRYLAHPIPNDMKSEIARQHIQEMNLIPMLNVYRNLHWNAEETGQGVLELDFLKKKSKFFLDHFATSYEEALKIEIETTLLEARKNEFKSYSDFISSNPILKNKMILGSGTGNRLSFPGISGVQELKLLAKLFDSNEIFLIPTYNTCSYLGGSYRGMIASGEEANLLILKENPIKNIDTLFQIDKVYTNGKAVTFNLPQPTKKKPSSKK